MDLAPPHKSTVQDFVAGWRGAVGDTGIHRLEGGRFVDGRDWGLVDWPGMLQQLGQPPAGPPSAGPSTGG